MTQPHCDDVTSASNDLVVLLGADLSPIGTANRHAVHGPDTPLHLAFSCYIFDGRDRVLVTRRALSKTTWPGVWTNSCCGHPRPGEDAQQAVRRRVREELGVKLHGLEPVLPDFRYRARSAEGIVENEFCPVYTAVTHDDPDPDPSEIAEWEWAPWSRFVALADAAPWAISPWAAQQVPLLEAQGVGAGTPS
ncbi:isopentenyl-diphosphate Delta-isomerase [Allosalinactinospora lopnorensis]|uniref:isopentenyl-diphosphate Delta-isomerase n=1 Tax=Allosalinactinospora lopnorensis TaxID=1352348 RepID=UPI000623EC11|nr:isopentenyl-diphosphate Delta-isomerase [Allosalinactinospora lopnorensis]